MRNTNAKINSAQTPLHNACNQGREAVVQLLLEHGAAVDTPDVRSGV